MVLCTPTKKRAIELLHDRGQTFTEIGQTLGIHRTTVARNWKKICTTHAYYATKPKTGCPKLLTPHCIRQAARAVTSGQASDACDVKRILFPNVSIWTVRRALCSVGLNGRLRRSKPFLSVAHIRKRSAWARQFGDWSEKDWQKVIFSDESKFNLFGPDGKQYCRRRPGEEFLLL